MKEKSLSVNQGMTCVRTKQGLSAMPNSWNLFRVAGKSSLAIKQDSYLHVRPHFLSNVLALIWSSGVSIYRQWKKRRLDSDQYSKLASTSPSALSLHIFISSSALFGSSNGIYSLLLRGPKLMYYFHVAHPWGKNFHWKKTHALIWYLVTRLLDHATCEYVPNYADLKFRQRMYNAKRIKILKKS